MKFCDGNTLKNFIDKHMKDNSLIKENILNKIVKQICIGLKEIHNNKIVHRDLKPENIYLNDNMNIKIEDFDILKQLNLYQTHELSKLKAGSDYYIAPKIKYQGIYNEKSDIWSLGCIIYELFTLNIYFIDTISRKIKKIDSNIFNYKWQELIDSLLQPDYKKRFDINQVCEFLEDELNINNKDSLNKENNIIKMKIDNKNKWKNNWFYILL